MSRRTQLRPAHLGLITAAALAAWSAPAQALLQDRVWSFASGCSTQDFNSTCWRAGLLGAPGASAPGLLDNVYILQDAATSLAVNFANAATTSTPPYSSVTLLGLGEGFAELAVARNSLRASTIDLGAAFGLPGSTSQSTRGRLRQTGGSISANILSVGSGANGAGEYLLSAGTVNGALLSVGTGEAATGRVIQTGGQATFSNLSMGSGGVFELRGGTLTLGTDNVGPRGGRFVMSGGAVSTVYPLRADTVQLAGQATVLQTNFLVDARLLQVGIADGSSSGSVRMSAGSAVDIFQVGAGAGQPSSGPLGLELLGGTHRVAERFAVGTSAQAWVLGGAMLDTQRLEIGSDGTRNGRLQVWGGQMNVRGEAHVGTANASTLADLRVVEGGQARVQGQLNIHGDATTRVTGTGSRLTVDGAVVMRGSDAGPQRPAMFIQGATAQMRDLRIDSGHVSVLGAGGALIVSGHAQTVGSESTLTVGDGAQVDFGSLIARGRVQLDAGSEARIGNFVEGGLHIADGARVVVRDSATLLQGYAFTGGGDVAFERQTTVFGGPFSIGGDVHFGSEAVTTLYQQELAPGLAVLSRLLVAGHVHLDGRFLLNTQGFSFAAGSQFDVLDWGSLSGTFDGFDFSAAPLSAGLFWDTSTFYDDGVLRVAAVPEPGTWAMWMAGLAGFGFIARRRRLG
jgi:hypothetical protein